MPGALRNAAGRAGAGVPKFKPVPCAGAGRAAAGAPKSRLVFTGPQKAKPPPPNATTPPVQTEAIFGGAGATDGVHVS